MAFGHKKIPGEILGSFKKITRTRKGCFQGCRLFGIQKKSLKKRDLEY